MAVLRARKPYLAPTDDSDDTAAPVLDPQEQVAVVQELELDAKRSGRVLKLVVLAMQAVVIVLHLLLPGPPVLGTPSRGCVLLSILASFIRLFLSLDSSRPPTVADVLPLLPTTLSSAVVLLTTTSSLQSKLLWGGSGWAMQALGIATEAEVCRSIQEAGTLREAMYDAPEA